MTNPETKQRRQGRGTCEDHVSRAFLPDEARPVEVRLRCRDTDKMLGFYHELLGLHLTKGAAGESALAGDRRSDPFIILQEDKQARRISKPSIGLFHLAIRFPSRHAFARACRRVLKSGYALDGASDHLVSEALYLSDPEGNGVELYADRPRSSWVWRDGQVAMGTQPLNLDELLATPKQSPDRGRPEGHPELGHIHLRVSNLAQAERFYREFLGLAVTTRAYPGALFFSAGGYHHHIAVNTWGSPAPARPNSVGLISYRFEVPCPEILYCLENRAPLVGVATERALGVDGAELLRVRDPNGNWLEIIGG
jgi:catechol 2,3-dioxygenase